MELLKHIGDAGSNTAVIIITGYADVPTAVSAIKIGAFHFVQKPVDAEALLSTVEEALARSNESRDLSGRNRRIQESVRGAYAARAGGLELAGRGIADQAHAHRLKISARPSITGPRSYKKVQARTISHLVRIALGLGHLNDANNSAK
jgi:FixJ family two-component response regulator